MAPVLVTSHAQMLRSVTRTRKANKKEVEQRRRHAKHKARNGRLLEMLMARQNDRCFWCGGIMLRTAFHDENGRLDRHKATVDHVIALAAGGATDDKNCVAACHDCNELRSLYNTGAWRSERDRQENRYRAEFRSLQQWMLQQLAQCRQERDAACDEAAMHLATIEMAARPESGWQKFRRWLRR